MGFASCRGGSGGDGVGSGGGLEDSPEGGLFSRCMDGMRKEAERCCWLNSVVMTHSLAGGTGSGLGSGLLQARCTTGHLTRNLNTIVSTFKSNVKSNAQLSYK